MEVVGGLYREICLRPAWNEFLGSGGRAARVVAAQGEPVTLHSYIELAERPAMDSYRGLPVELRLSDRQSPICFAYFHPLSRPHLEWPVRSPSPPIKVEGETVLRFGFVEGDAIVSGRRVVFDPQGRRPSPYRENGSTAEELALVLNEDELRAMTSDAPLEERARSLIENNKAEVIVVKRGFRGALVIDHNLNVDEIPAFQSEKVFKIGTGDIFSALFALEWGVRHKPAADAARKASLGVASYAGTQSLALPEPDQMPQAVGGRPLGAVLVLGEADSIGRAYTLEEALFRLRELGVDARSAQAGTDSDWAAVLVLGEGLSERYVVSVLGNLRRSIPIIALDETATMTVPFEGDIDITDDFTTSLYRVAWASCTAKRA